MNTPARSGNRVRSCGFGDDGIYWFLVETNGCRRRIFSEVKGGKVDDPSDTDFPLDVLQRAADKDMEVAR